MQRTLDLNQRTPDSDILFILRLHAHDLTTTIYLDTGTGKRSDQEETDTRIILYLHHAEYPGFKSAYPGFRYFLHPTSPCTWPDHHYLLDCLWSQKLCLKSDPRYEACRNWSYSVFNHFRVCWIQCRAVPSSTIYAKARILRFKIGLENRSKILQKQSCQQVMSQYKTHTCCFVCDPPYEAC